MGAAGLVVPKPTYPHKKFVGLFTTRLPSTVKSPELSPSAFMLTDEIVIVLAGV